MNVYFIDNDETGSQLDEDKAYNANDEETELDLSQTRNEAYDDEDNDNDNDNDEPLSKTENTSENCALEAKSAGQMAGDAGRKKSRRKSPKNLIKLCKQQPAPMPSAHDDDNEFIDETDDHLDGKVESQFDYDADEQPHDNSQNILFTNDDDDANDLNE